MCPIAEDRRGSGRYANGPMRNSAWASLRSAGPALALFARREAVFGQNLLTLRRHDEIGEPLCCGRCAVHDRQASVCAGGKRIEIF